MFVSFKLNLQINPFHVGSACLKGLSLPIEVTYPCGYESWGHLQDFWREQTILMSTTTGTPIKLVVRWPYYDCSDSQSHNPEKCWETTAALWSKTRLHVVRKRWPHSQLALFSVKNPCIRKYISSNTENFDYAQLQNFTEILPLSCSAIQIGSSYR